MDKNIDKRVLKTKKNLYDGLLEVMKDKTFEDIKVSNICEKAMTNRSTFYDHFSDKYELLSSLMEDLKNELIKTLENNDKENTSLKEYYMKMIELLLDHISINIDIYNAILNKNSNSIVMDMLYDTLFKDIRKEIEKSVKSPKVPVEIITKFYVTAVTNICLEYIRYPKKYKKETIIKYLEILIPSNFYEDIEE